MGKLKVELTEEFERTDVNRYFLGVVIVDALRWNGAAVTIIGNADGISIKQTPVKEPTNEAGAIKTSVDKRAYNVGDVLPDGWVVGPRSPQTGIVMAIEPVSGALEGYKTWYQGEDHAKELREKGNANARQPGADNNNDELNSIFNEVVKAGRNQKAQFNASGSDPYGRYWSGTSHPVYRDYARMQYFGDGIRGGYFKVYAYARVRCVRDEPGLMVA